MRVAYTERFLGDLRRVELASKQDEILDAIELLPFVPEMGSTRLPESIVDEYGPQVRKLVVKPLIVLYELREYAGGGLADDDGLIVVNGLVHSRRAW